MLANLADTVLFVVTVLVLAFAVYAFIHAALQRSDAYTAAEKLTKPVWLLILGGSVLVTLLLGGLGAIIAACAAGVYVVDVRPKLLDIQGKSR